MRLIDADALKTDIVAEGQRSRRYKLGEIWELNRAEIYKVIDEQPTIEPEPHWIPCSERLPQEEVDVLCCRDNKTMAIMHFNPVLTTRYPKGFSVVEGAFSWRQDNVVAWMPLPEPYREGES